MENEFKKRVDAFMEDYKKAVEVHKVDFAQYPVYIPDEKGGFRTVIQNTPVDTTKISTPSPFVQK